MAYSLRFEVTLTESLIIINMKNQPFWGHGFYTNVSRPYCIPHKLKLEYNSTLSLLKFVQSVSLFIQYENYFNVSLILLPNRLIGFYLYDVEL